MTQTIAQRLREIADRMPNALPDGAGYVLNQDRQALLSVAAELEAQPVGDPSMTAEPSNAEIVRQALVRLTPPRFVCIRAHKGTNDWKAGDIAVLPRGLDSANEPDNWRPCDAEGWIAHVPTADAVCPVPEGVEFEVKRRMGCVSRTSRHSGSWRSRGAGGETEPIAWRPVVQ